MEIPQPLNRSTCLNVQSPLGVKKRVIFSSILKEFPVFQFVSVASYLVTGHY